MSRCAPRPAFRSKSSALRRDIAIFILWARLGTRLPAHLTRPDGSRYASGTEFEFEDAVWGYRQQGQPDVLVYRKTAVPMIPLGPEARERVVQKEALDAFVTAWFQDPQGALTAAFHPFHSPARFEELLEAHLHKLLSARLPGLPEGPERALPPLWTQGSPFRGLEVFEREHAPVFCGRTQAVSEVLGALRQQAADGRAFVLVSGSSGVGKSSLVRAGVLPSLTQPGVIDGIGLWRQAVLRPSDRAGTCVTDWRRRCCGRRASPSWPPWVSRRGSWGRCSGTRRRPRCRSSGRG